MFTITGDIVTPDGVLNNGALTVDDKGFIAEVGARSTVPPRSSDIDAGGLLVLPGFADVHVHGGGGADFMHGTPDAVRQIACIHARNGTTSLLATTLTASRADTDAAIVAARSAVNAGPGEGEARVLGIHLEGPYICAAKRGAQPEAFVRPPDAEELRHWITLSQNTIRKITLAPEMPGAEAAIRLAHAHGVTVSIGHTNATAAEAEAAIDWGAASATHLFNAMPPLHHREPGAAGAALARPEIACELIADGVHLHPLIVKLDCRRQRAARRDADYRCDGRHGDAGRRVRAWRADGFSAKRHSGVCRRDFSRQRLDHEPGVFECPPLRPYPLAD